MNKEKNNSLINDDLLKLIDHAETQTEKDFKNLNIATENFKKEIIKLMDKFINFFK